MSMLNYDFRYVEHRSKGFNHTQIGSAVQPDAYKERYRVKRRPFPWLAVVLMLAAIWGLVKVVFG